MWVGCGAEAGWPWNIIFFKIQTNKRQKNKIKSTEKIWTWKKTLSQNCQEVGVSGRQGLADNQALEVTAAVRSWVLCSHPSWSSRTALHPSLWQCFCFLVRVSIQSAPTQGFWSFEKVLNSVPLYVQYILNLSVCYGFGDRHMFCIYQWGGCFGLVYFGVQFLLATSRI